VVAFSRHDATKCWENPDYKGRWPPYWKPKKKPILVETGAVVLDVQEDMVLSLFDLLEDLMEEAEDAKSEEEVLKQEVICKGEASDNDAIPVDMDTEEKLWVRDMEQDEASLFFF
jgi:hypothetical protein